MTRRHILMIAAFAVVMMLLGSMGSSIIDRFFTQFRSLSEDARPVTDWIIVNDLTVADGKVGDDLDVTFTRTVSVPLHGFWSAEVHSTEGRSMCREVSGNSRYTHIEPRTQRFVLSRYAPGCEKLPAGAYRVSVVIWVAPTRGQKTKPISFQSNVFRVSE